MPLWVDFMSRVLLDHTTAPARRLVHGDFPPPPGVVRVAIDPDTGLLARGQGGRVVWEYYREGSEPTDVTPDKNELNPNEVDVFTADPPL